MKRGKDGEYTVCGHCFFGRVGLRCATWNVFEVPDHGEQSLSELGLPGNTIFTSSDTVCSSVWRSLHIQAAPSRLTFATEKYASTQNVDLRSKHN